MSVKPVFQKLDVGKLGKPYPRLETKSSVKRSRKKKKTDRQSTAENFFPSRSVEEMRNCQQESEEDSRGEE
ncbi:hypothetical protein KIN20_009654 [Parelaphostrongylus tenuis]|uniref:Uncharacterized protein n=1 Tax=Parelaphostrongylus tenuis TaxID=148309 RepID=A0AAD5MY20_PARTN|nr:hypothetical protein KIN20_009654 [Parelaphostrongylus tenuis]